MSWDNSSTSVPRQPHAPLIVRPSRQSRFRRGWGGGGFSLIEVMVVVVIIGLLAGAVAIKVSGYIDKARINRARADIASIVDAVEAFYADNSRYPTNDEGLSALPLKTTTDPWGRTYQYNFPGRENDFDIVSYGADGRQGGDGIDADVTSASLTVEAKP